MQSTLARDPATILVIDSDALTLTGIAAMLHYAGHECHCARDVEAAWKAARSLPLDLIVCGVELGGENGIQLVRDLKQQAGLGDVPVIFLSGGEMPNIVQRAHDAGGSFYLRKPFDPDVLSELVDKALWLPHLVRNKVGHMHLPRRAANVVHGR